MLPYLVSRIDYCQMIAVAHFWNHFNSCHSEENNENWNNKVFLKLWIKHVSGILIAFQFNIQPAISWSGVDEPNSTAWRIPVGVEGNCRAGRWDSATTTVLCSQMKTPSNFSVWIVIQTLKDSDRIGHKRFCHILYFLLKMILLLQSHLTRKLSRRIWLSQEGSLLQSATFYSRKFGSRPLVVIEPCNVTESSPQYFNFYFQLMIFSPF